MCGQCAGFEGIHRSHQSDIFAFYIVTQARNSGMQRKRWLAVNTARVDSIVWSAKLKEYVRTYVRLPCCYTVACWHRNNDGQKEERKSNEVSSAE